MHFRAQDVYTDTSGKIRKAKGAVPIYDDVQQLKNLSKTSLRVNNGPEVAPTEAAEVEPEYEDIEYLDDDNEFDSTACPETLVNCSTKAMHCDEEVEISIDQNCSNCIATME